jgi:hypothetical protein
MDRDEIIVAVRRAKVSGTGSLNVSGNGAAFFRIA